MSQLHLDAVGPAPAHHRVRALAAVLAGFRWPDRGSFEKLKKEQKEAALRAAHEALEALGRAPD